MPELEADAAVDDKVDGGVEDEEDVGGGEEDQEGDWDAVAAELPAAVLKVLRGVVRRVGELVDLEGQTVGVAEDEDQYDGN